MKTLFYIGIIIVSTLSSKAENTPSAQNSQSQPITRPQMYFADHTQKDKPFAKDPDVVKWKGKYLMYYTTGSYNDGRPNDGFGIGIAQSPDMINWTKATDFTRDKDYENKGAVPPA
jgi:predicted GH43/DUF377 family glycosyl hydrolase